MASLKALLLRPVQLPTLLQPSAFASTSKLTLNPFLSTASNFSTTTLASVGQQLPPSFSTTSDDIVYDRQAKNRKDVLLSNLPHTATPTDIRSLAISPKTARDLGRIEFIYTKSLRPSGKALLSFSSPIHASAFEYSAQSRILGGKQLSASLRHTSDREKFLKSIYGLWPTHFQLPLDLIEYETGKLVLLSNIPQDTSEARLEERLAGRYDLKPQDRWRGKRTSFAGYELDKKGWGGSHDKVLGGVVKLEKWHWDATTCSFLVRCQTQGEAMRLVRRWHNTFWAPASYDIQDTGGRYRLGASILY